MDTWEIYLPLAWGFLLSVAVFMYVLLDGFDLGMGIVFPFRRSERDRDVMMNTVAPFWDGNETWLVLGGGGLLVAFPLAYAVMMPALYLPVIFMLLGLIFRGVSFEFRFKADKSKGLWSTAFFGGSITAAFFQGVILGAYVQGIEVDGRAFSGGPFDWLSAFSVMTGFAVIAGYVYLGASWLVMKTEGGIQEWAYAVAEKALLAVAAFMAMVILWMPFLHSGTPLLSGGLDEVLRSGLVQRWFGGWHIILTSLVPISFIGVTLYALRSLRRKAEYAPFICGMLLFVTGFAGLAISLWPNIIPYSINLFEAAAAPSSQLFMLVGALVLLPVILGYTAYIYYIFRGKVGHEGGYH